MKRKKLIIFSLLYLASMPIFSQEDEGMIFFTNFNFIHSKKRNFSSSGHRHPALSEDVSSPAKGGTEEPVPIPLITPKKSHIVESEPHKKDTKKENNIPTPAIKPATKTKKISPPSPSVPKPVHFPKPPTHPSAPAVTDSYYTMFIGYEFIAETDTKTTYGDLYVNPSMNVGMGTLIHEAVLTNQGNITVLHGDTSNTMAGMVSLDKGTIINGDKGTILVTGSGSTTAVAMVGLPSTVRSSIINEGKITASGNAIGMSGGGDLTNSGTIQMDGAVTAMAIRGKGLAHNTGTITASSTLYGIYGVDGASLINDGMITVSGYPEGQTGVAMAIFNEGEAINNNTIDVSGHQVAMFATGEASIRNEKTGVLNIQDGRGMVAYMGATAENNGSIL